MKSVVFIRGDSFSKVQEYMDKGNVEIAFDPVNPPEYDEKDQARMPPQVRSAYDDAVAKAKKKSEVRSTAAQMRSDLKKYKQVNGDSGRKLELTIIDPEYKKDPDARALWVRPEQLRDKKAQGYVPATLAMVSCNGDYKNTKDERHGEMLAIMDAKDPRKVELFAMIQPGNIKRAIDWNRRNKTKETLGAVAVNDNVQQAIREAVENAMAGNEMPDD